MFRVGQKVVCVDDSPRFTQTCAVKVGRIYTITGIYKEGLGVQVAEIKPTCARLGFFADRFRPVQERPTSIAVFRAILDDVNAKKKERVG